MIDYITKRPMIIAAAGCVLTAVCGFYFETLLMICFVTVMVLFCFALFSKSGKMAVVTALILFMGVNCFATLKHIDNLKTYINKEITADIIFTQTDYRGSTSFRSDCEVVGESVLPKGTKISLWHKPEDVDFQYVFKARILLEDVDQDFKAMNYGKGIYINGSIKAMENIGEYDDVARAVNSVRQYIKRTLFGKMSFDSASTMSAIVFGDNSYFSKQFYNNVKASGVAHVMVVSGMHLSILVTLVLNFSEKIIYNPQIRALIMYLVVILLSSVCGFTMSILRAGVTFVIMGVGLLLNQYNCPENSLAGAVTLISIFSPFAIFSVAFQLSVLSTFGILAVSVPVCRYIKDKWVKVPKFMKGILYSVVTTISAMILTLPVVIYVFGYVSVVGVVTNLLISSVVTVALCVCVVSLVIGLVFPHIAELIFGILDYVVMYINSVINFMGSLPFATVDVPRYFTIFAVLLIFCLFWLLLACKKREYMIKLKEINKKVIRERGSSKKWRLFLKKH